MTGQLRNDDEGRYRALANAMLEGREGYIARHYALGDRGSIQWMIGALWFDVDAAGIALSDDRQCAIVEECLAARAQADGHRREHLVDVLTYNHAHGTDQFVYATQEGAYRGMARLMREWLSEMRSQYVTDPAEDCGGEPVGARLLAIDVALTMESRLQRLDKSAREELDNAAEHWRQLTQHGEEFSIDSLPVNP